MKQTMIVALCIMVLFPAAILPAAEPNNGTLSGRLMIKNDGPLEGGMAFLFNDAAGPPPSPDLYWRVPDEIVPVDSEGRFKAELVAGKYYVGAIKRLAGKEVGPPQEGDLFLTSRDAKGEPRAYLVRKGERTDIGTLTEAVPFKRSTLKTKEGITAIEGTVVDSAGNPVEGALVFAFLTPAMLGKPVFVSERTGKDGKYLLRVLGSGNYYLKTRDVYGGGPPRVGALVGGYGEGTPAAAKARSGEITKGIVLRGTRFAGQGPRQ